MEKKTSYFRLIISIIVIAILTIVTGCAGGSAADENINADPQTICQEPRPQMCTREYRPVCAERKDGSFKTYSNGCTSCTDSNVIGYREGACESSK